MRGEDRGILTILFVLPDAGWGGAQRTFVNVVNNLDRERFRPIVALYRKEGAFLDQLRKDAVLLDLKCSSARASVRPLAKAVRAGSPDVVVSTLRYVNLATVLAARLSRTRTPVVVRETNHFTAAGIGAKSWRERLVGWSYRRADKVVALSDGVREDIMNRYAVPPDQVVTIYNPIDIDSISTSAAAPDDRAPVPGTGNGSSFEIIVVGALEYQKGHDLLIRALGQLGHIPLRLKIVGDGSEKSRLVRVAEDLGVSERVAFFPFQQNPYASMARADLFVLPSRWEGFGHVVAEAMACGVPVLAARCPAGPDEIITDGVDGSLCAPNSTSALAHHIEKLWGEPSTRERYAAAGRESVKRFDVRSIVPEYERLFLEVSAHEDHGSDTVS